MKNSITGNLIRKQYLTPTSPEEPFKRKLTAPEARVMRLHFRNHGYSSIDNRGHIVLNGGCEMRGLYYITEDDLEKLVNL